MRIGFDRIELTTIADNQFEIGSEILHGLILILREFLRHCAKVHGLSNLLEIARHMFRQL